MDDTNAYVRTAYAWMLGRYKSDARVAVPKLLNFLNDPDLSVRNEATSAIKLIEPEALNPR